MHFLEAQEFYGVTGKAKPVHFPGILGSSYSEVYSRIYGLPQALSLMVAVAVAMAHDASWLLEKTPP